jgi:hypothetical protein
LTTSRGRWSVRASRCGSFRSGFGSMTGFMPWARTAARNSVRGRGVRGAPSTEPATMEPVSSCSLRRTKDHVPVPLSRPVRQPVGNRLPGSEAPRQVAPQLIQLLA